MVWPWELSETVGKESNTLLHVHSFDVDNSAKLNCLGCTFSSVNHIYCSFCLLFLRSRRTLGCFPSLKLTLVGLAQEATSIYYRATMETPHNDNLFNNCNLFLHKPCCSIRWLMSLFSTNAASCFSFSFICSFLQETHVRLITNTQVPYSELGCPAISFLQEISPSLYFYFIYYLTRDDFSCDVF